jgi:excisionase family DNA binding protein
VKQSEGDATIIDVSADATRAVHARREDDMNRATATDDAHHSNGSHVDRMVGHELLTVQDAARFLNVSVSWVYEHTRDDAEDRLPFVKLGKYVRFDRTDLREYIDAKRHASRNGARRR